MTLKRAVIPRTVKTVLENVVRNKVRMARVEEPEAEMFVVRDSISIRNVKLAAL